MRFCKGGLLVLSS